MTLTKQDLVSIKSVINLGALETVPSSIMIETIKDFIRITKPHDYTPKSVISIFESIIESEKSYNSFAKTGFDLIEMGFMAFIIDIEKIWGIYDPKKDYLDAINTPIPEADDKTLLDHLKEENKMLKEQITILVNQIDPT